MHENWKITFHIVLVQQIFNNNSYSIKKIVFQYLENILIDTEFVPSFNAHLYNKITCLIKHDLFYAWYEISKSE